VDTVDDETIVRVARAQSVSREEARRAAVFDAVTAAAGREMQPTEWLERSVERAALARSLLADLRAEARRQGPPTDAEIGRITEERFWELDRPELRRTTHAVVRSKEATNEARARAVAEEIRRAVASAEDADDFLQLARAVAVPSELEVRVEHLSPCDREGRVLDPESPPASLRDVTRYAPDFARAVFELTRPTEVSSIVRTSFGYHVIYFAQRIESARVPLEERRARLADEALSRRARRLHEELLEKARKSTTVVIERSAMAHTEKVRVSP
jgi:hypothetical protein